MRRLTLIGAFLFSITIFSPLSIMQASAVCDPIPTTAQAKFSIKAENDGTYNVWLLMKSSEANDSLWLQADDQCPVVVGDSNFGNNFTWVNNQSGDAKNSLKLNLTAGDHTITIAGRESNVSLDKIALIATDCKPVNDGRNCSVETSTSPAKQAPTPSQSKGLNWLMIIAAVVGIVALGFLIAKFLHFHFKKLPHIRKDISGKGILNSHLAISIRHFFDHHKLTVIICSTLILSSLIVGVAAALAPKTISIESETGTLSGSVKIVEDSKASGGKYLLFENTPPAQAANNSQKSNNKPGSSSGGNNNGNPSNPGGGSPGPTTCPAFPDFPTPSCTGWEHTGVTLTTVNERYYPEEGEVLDGKDFRNGIVIYNNNVTIKRSRVQCGNECPGIWLDWNVSGTVIEDVEITSNSKTDRLDRAVTAGKTYNTTMRRIYAHDIQRGLLFGYSATLEDNYVGPLYNPTEAHVSTIGGDTGSDTVGDLHLIVRHNYIDATPGQNNSGALLYYPPQGYSSYGHQQVDILIEKNIIQGGSYCMWLSSDPQMSGTLVVRNNYFSTKHWDTCGAYNTHFTDKLFGSNKEGDVNVAWENNVWYAPGKAKHGTQVPLVAQ